MQTPLSRLMDATGLTAKEIADGTGINVTLLSKLKNNQRKMQYRSRYPLLLADFFLQCRAEHSGGAVTALLSRAGIEPAKSDPRQLREQLALWLTACEEEEVPACSSPMVSVFHDAGGLAALLEPFTARVLAAPAATVSVLHDFPDMQLPTTLLEFAAPYLEKMKHHGCPLRIIDGCPAPKTYMTIFNWLEFYFSDQLQFFSAYNRPHLHRMLFLLEDECALLVQSGDTGRTVFHGTLYTDRDSVGYFRRIADIAAETSVKLVEKLPFSNITEFLHALDRFLHHDATTYLVNPVAMYKTMNSDILSRVLQENGIPEADWNAAFETNRFTAYLRTKCPYKQLYDLSAMKRIAVMDSVEDEELSALYGRPITVPRRLLHEHLRYLRDLHSSENYDLLFVPFESLHLLHDSISYVVQKDSLFLAWDTSRSTQRIYSRDSAIVQASCRYMEEIWNAIPAPYTDRAWQKQQLDLLLQLSAQ